MTNELARLRELSRNATQGPWRAERTHIGHRHIAGSQGTIGIVYERNPEHFETPYAINAEFIVACVNYVRALLAASPLDEQSGGDDAREMLKRIYAAYVNLLESGRDRIIFLGGSCDPVDRMEEGDPVLRKVRAFLKASPAPSEAEKPLRPEEEAEAFIQAAVDNSPEPLRRLGEWLTHKLDDDDWKTAERMLLGATLAPAPEAEKLKEALRTTKAFLLRLNPHHLANDVFMQLESLNRDIDEALAGDAS